MTTEQRINRIERQSLLQRRVGLAVLAAVATVVLLGVGVSGGNEADVVEASEFRLVDRHGETRAKLSQDERGIWLTLLDARSNANVLLGSTPEGPMLALFSEKERYAATLSNFDNVGPMLALSDASGKPGTWLTVAKTGPELVLNDRRGVGRAGLVVLDDGPALRLCDGRGRPIWTAP